MRKWIILLMAAFCLSFPVSAQAVYRGETDFGQIAFDSAEGESDGTYPAHVELKNDAAFPVGVFVSARSETAGALCLTVRQAGKTSTVFEGDAGALSRCRVLLCTLDPQCSASLYAELKDTESTEPAPLALAAEPLKTPGTENRVKLIFYVCIWMALVIFGSYLAIVIANKFGRKK